MQQVKWSLIFVVVMVIQSSFVQLIAIHDIRPDLLIVVLVLYSYRFGQMRSTIAGFFVGLLQDILTGGLLGLSSFTKSIVGFLSGFTAKKEKQSSVNSYLVTLTVVTVVHNILFFTLYTIDIDISGTNLILYSILPASIYTILSGILIFYMLSIYK